MLNVKAAALVLSCAILLGSRSWAQTETPTRRPTPVPTATRTATGVLPTPTLPAGGTSVFLCSLGANDGALCSTDDDCGGGSCVLAQGVCDGGSADGIYCEASDACSNGTCRATQRVCLSGDSKGVSCLRDDQCPDSQCVSTGLFCDGGDFEFFSCIDDGGCIGVFEDGACQSPDVLLCSGGTNDLQECISSLDCPAGACVIAQKICIGGEANGLDCEGIYDCPGGECHPTAQVCNGGKNVGFGCVAAANNCPGGSCVSTGKLCDGGVFDSISCVTDDSCSPEGEDPAPCVTPGPNFYCSGGENDGAACASDDDCPGGACVFSQGVCDGTGGNTDGDLCESNTDCGGSIKCVQTQKVCLAGDLAGQACLADRHCGSGILCGSSGLFCVGGDFEDLSCVDDVNCCDDDGCSDTDTNDGVCLATDVLLCSGGANDSDACESHIDCPGGACVVAQRVCDGGDLDGFDCQGNVNCEGSACVATSHVCSGGDADSFGCLRGAHCFGGGSCVATGQVCDGGDTSASDYDPFFISFSCTNDQACGGAPFSCESPGDRGLACSAGAQDGGNCATNEDCSGGVCVLEDSLCDGGARDGFLCDTDADCPNGMCRATWRVCSDSGFSCVDTDHCDSGESCIATGKVCLGSNFGAFSCVDDSNCFDSDNPNDVSGACVGLTPRACSLEAPCTLDDFIAEDVFGFSVDPVASPATFDFYLAPIPPGAVGVSVVLRPSGGDADLFVGRQVSTSILSAIDYPFASNNSDDTTDLVRISPESDPTFDAFTDGLGSFAIAVAGAGGATTYSLETVFLGDSADGDADCDGQVNQDDLDGLVLTLFDPAARISEEGSPIGRCIGADGNDDGIESAADLVAAIRHIGVP